MTGDDQAWQAIAAARETFSRDELAPQFDVGFALQGIRWHDRPSQNWKDQKLAPFQVVLGALVDFLEANGLLREDPRNADGEIDHGFVLSSQHLTVEGLALVMDSSEHISRRLNYWGDLPSTASMTKLMKRLDERLCAIRHEKAQGTGLDA